ncbi:MAG: J domain-containing protein [Geminicoccaceae bacterium]|nr:J domain-containing protein [Geminicoccaceae bacterium]
MNGSLYRVLGLGRDASDADIQKAYRRLAKSSHPDLHPGDKAAEERFKTLARANDILGDKDKRALYDQGLIDDDGNEVHPGFNGGFRARPGGGRTSTGGFSFRAGAGAGGFDDVLKDLFGNARPGGRGGFDGGAGFEPRGGDVRSTLRVGFIEAARGATRRVVLPDGRTLDVKVPAGAEDGQTLRLRGQGGPAPGGLGKAGDLLVTLEIEPHARFRRDGVDVHLDQPVPLAVAVAGGSVRVPTLDGEVSLKVPAWTSSGKVMRLKGRGVARAKHQGDQLVRLLVDLPEKPDPDLKAALERWARAKTA